MILTLDVGNSQIFCGVFDGTELKATFRRSSSIRASSDEFGTFFRVTLRENEIDPDRIEAAAICSVAPGAVHSLRNCFRKYFGLEPFLLQPDAATVKRMLVVDIAEIGNPDAETRRFLLKAYAIDADKEGAGWRDGFRLGAATIDNAEAKKTLANSALSSIEIARCLWRDYGTGQDPGLCR